MQYKERSVLPSTVVNRQAYKLYIAKRKISMWSGSVQCEEKSVIPSTTMWMSSYAGWREKCDS